MLKNKWVYILTVLAVMFAVVAIAQYIMKVMQ